MNISLILLTGGLLFILGLITDITSKKLPVPRVTLLIIAGFIIGPEMLNILPPLQEEWFNLFVNVSLVMVGFHLGGKMKYSEIKRYGKTVMSISISVVIITAMAVFLSLIAFGAPVELAIILAAVSTATAPAATIDVVNEQKADGRFSKTLVGIVAVDDIWAILFFSFLVAAAQLISGNGAVAETLYHAFWEVGGAVLVGVFLGIPMAFLSGRVQKGEPTMAEALGFVFLCGGLSLMLNVSYLLASMVLGAVVVNTAKHHVNTFNAIKGIEWPFLIIFFLLSGASLHISTLAAAGTFGIVYIIFRSIGRVIGVWPGSIISNAGRTVRNNMGMALLPQAGVAIGLSLVAAQKFPELKETILSVVVGATVFFELVGPILTRKALSNAGEIGIMPERDDMIHSLTVFDLMDKAVTPIKDNMTLPQLVARFQETGFLYYPVVNKRGHLAGIININAIKEILHLQSLNQLLISSDIMEASKVKICENQKLYKAKELMELHRLSYLPVVNTEDTVIGIIELKAIQDYISQQVKKKLTETVEQ